MSAYRQIANFAPNIQNDYSANPLLYCLPDSLNSQFLHGTQGRTFGKYNRACSEYMAARCAVEWDDICEQASTNLNKSYPDMTLSVSGEQDMGLTAGEILIRDTAYKKYKVQSRDCNLQCVPFDPTVTNSPVICYESPYPSNALGWSSGDQPDGCSTGVEGGGCFSAYGLTPDQIQNIDYDPVMNKLINNPKVAPNLLANIHTNMRDSKTLSYLKGTRLGALYALNGYPMP